MSRRVKLGAIGLRSTHLALLAAELIGHVSIVRVLALDDEADFQPPAGIKRWSDEEGFLADLDGVLVLTRDGRRHLRDAAPALAVGLPVFVDKPLACSVTDAATLLDGPAVQSFSMLRFLPAVARLGSRPRWPLRITVPADPASPYGGRWFHGIHAAELAAEIAGPDLAVSQVAFDGEVLRIGLGGAPGPIELCLDARTPEYRIEAADDVIVLDAAASYALGAVRLEQFFAHGNRCLSREQMLAPVRILADAFRAGASRSFEFDQRGR